MLEKFAQVILLSILMCYPVLTWANTAHQNYAFDLKLQEYIDVVNQTKMVLDNPKATPSALEQKQALCKRIQAYKNIAKLSQENLELDSAPIMNRVSQNFLDRQEKSFNASAMSEQVFCAKTTQKDVKIN